MRRYQDPVEVRRGVVSAVAGDDTVEGPEQFLWHGRLWKVRAVLAHWVETGPWWQSSGARAVVGDDAFVEEQPVATPDLLAEREMWRVEAGTGMTNAGVFDLSFSWSDGRWQLVGCAD